MSQCSRRLFLKTGMTAGALAGTGALPLRAAPGKATDWVTLGKSGVKVTRLAFGTGTINGQVQGSTNSFATPMITGSASSNRRRLTLACSRCWGSH